MRGAGGPLFAGSRFCLLASLSKDQWADLIIVESSRERL
jgi:hypothetical protein